MHAQPLFFNARNYITVPRGTVIYAEGEPGSHMYGIVDGAVDLQKGGCIVASLGPDDVFGERALIDHQPRNVTAVATANTVLAEIDRYMFLFLIDMAPTFALDIMSALAERLRRYDDLFGEMPLAIT
jgi:CRP-like cAMP-binding protein